MAYQSLVRFSLKAAVRHAQLRCSWRKLMLVRPLHQHSDACLPTTGKPAASLVARPVRAQSDQQHDEQSDEQLQQQYKDKQHQEQPIATSTQGNLPARVGRAPKRATAAPLAPCHAHAKPRIGARAQQRIREAAQLAGLSDRARKQQLAVLRALVPDINQQLQALPMPQLVSLLTADEAGVAAIMVKDSSEPGSQAATASRAGTASPAAVDRKRRGRRSRSRKAAAVATAAPAPWEGAVQPQLSGEAQQLLRTAAWQAGLTLRAAKERLQQLLTFVPTLAQSLHNLQAAQLAALLNADNERMAIVLMQLQQAVANANLDVNAAVIVASCPALLLSDPGNAARSTTSSSSTRKGTMESGRGSAGNGSTDSGSTDSGRTDSNNNSNNSCSLSSSSRSSSNSSSSSSTNNNVALHTSHTGQLESNACADHEAEDLRTMMSGRVGALQRCIERLLQEPRHLPVLSGATAAMPPLGIGQHMGPKFVMRMMLAMHPQLLCHSAGSISKMAIVYKQVTPDAPAVRFLIVDDEEYFVDILL